MKWRYFLFFIAVGLLIEAPLIYCGLNPIYAMAAALIIIMLSYYAWWGLFNKKLSAILEEDCDPLRFIEEYERAKNMSKRPVFQNYCNLNIAIGLGALGRNEEALEMLLNGIDHSLKNSRAFEATYHMALFCCLLNSDSLEDAEAEYENYLKKDRGLVKSPAFIFALDAAVAEYEYKLNKSPEGARTFLERLDSLYNAYTKRLTKRVELNLLYNRADMLAILGEHKSAAENYRIVAEKGGKLWIGEQSREKAEKLAH